MVGQVFPNFIEVQILALTRHMQELQLFSGGWSVRSCDVSIFTDLRVICRFSNIYR